MRLAVSDKYILFTVSKVSVYLKTSKDVVLSNNPLDSRVWHVCTHTIPESCYDHKSRPYYQLCGTVKQDEKACTDRTDDGPSKHDWKLLVA